MSKLLRANMMRLKKDKVFWLCAAVMAVIGAAIPLTVTGTTPEGVLIDQVFFFYALPLEFVCAIFCGLFIGTEHSDGTMRNKIVIGQSRVCVYLSNLLACAVAGMGFILAYVIPMLAVGLTRLGGFKTAAAPLLALAGISVLMMLAVCALLTLISMLGGNRAIVAVISLVSVLALLFFAVWINSRLQEPEFHSNYVYTDDAGAMSELEPEPNPNYLSGQKRSAFQFIFELLPTGQAMLFMDAEIMAPVMNHLWRPPLLSLAVLLLTTAAGLYLFRKKDLR